MAQAPRALFLCVAGLVLGAAAAQADGIVFKKARPNDQAGKRITIQITEEEDWYKRVNREKQVNQKTKGEDADPEDVTAVVAKPKAQVDGHDWFWQANSPALEDAAFNRMESALLSLGNNPAAQARLSPRLSTYQTLANKYGSDILLATLGKEVSPALVLAVIGVESSGKADAESSAGAVGLMQLMDATAKRFEVTDRTDPKQSIKGGAAYLAWLLREFQGDPLLALAGYNAGENAVKKHNGVPPYPETRAYVPKVIAAWGVARALCMSPPKHPTDGCVFKKDLSK